MPIGRVLCESPTFQELGGGMQWKHGGRKVWMSASSLSVKVQPKMLRDELIQHCCSPLSDKKNRRDAVSVQSALAFIVIQERAGLYPYSLRWHFPWHYDIIDCYVIAVVVSPLWYSCLQWIKLQESLYCVYKMHLALMGVMFQGLWIFALLSTTWLHNLITISQVPLGKSWMDAVADQK